MKKVFLGLLIVASFNALAGGRGGSWQPSVQPLNCVVGTSQGWQWKNDLQCNEVIDKGYAKGVRYQGSFVYDDGYTKNFDVIVAPGQTANVIHEQGHGRYKFSSTGGASWIR